MATLLPLTSPVPETGSLDGARRFLGRRGSGVSERLTGQGWTAAAYVSVVFALAEWATQRRTAFADLNWLVSSSAAQAPWFHLAAAIDHALPMPAVELLGWLVVLVSVEAAGLMQQVHRGLRHRSGPVAERLGLGPLAGLSWLAGFTPAEAREHADSGAVDAGALCALVALRGHRLPMCPSGTGWGLSWSASALADQVPTWPAAIQPGVQRL